LKRSSVNFGRISSQGQLLSITLVFKIDRHNTPRNSYDDLTTLSIPTVLDGQLAAMFSIICQVLRRAGIHPESISYVEGHGTGTQMGDSIEISHNPGI
jgi:hypothetical protein